MTTLRYLFFETLRILARPAAAVLFAYFLGGAARDVAYELSSARAYGAALDSQIRAFEYQQALTRAYAEALGEGADSSHGR